MSSGSECQSWTILMENKYLVAFIVHETGLILYVWPLGTRIGGWVDVVYKVHDASGTLVGFCSTRRSPKSVSKVTPLITLRLSDNDLPTLTICDRPFRKSVSQSNKLPQMP